MWGEPGKAWVRARDPEGISPMEFHNSYCLEGFECAYGCVSGPEEGGGGDVFVCVCMSGTSHTGFLT